MRAPIVEAFQDFQRIMVVCPKCGEIHRLSEMTLTYRAKPKRMVASRRTRVNPRTSSSYSGSWSFPPLLWGTVVSRRGRRNKVIVRIQNPVTPRRDDAELKQFFLIHP